MRNLLQLMKQEWEITCAVLLVGAGVIALFWALLADDSGFDTEIRSRKNWHYGCRYTAGDLAFLDESSDQLKMDLKSPFAGKVPEKTAPGQKKIPQKKASPPVVVRKDQLPALPQKKETVTAAGKIPQIPEKKAPIRKTVTVLEPRLAQFVFYRQNQAGKAVAIVRMMNKKQKNLVYTFYTGQKKEGLSILEISQECVKIRDARGKVLRLELQKWTRLAVAPDVAE